MRINQDSDTPVDARHLERMTRVWDPVVRLFHWGLVVSCVVAWLTRHSSQAVHETAGLAAAGLILVRLVWGFVGSHYARFSQFVRGPRRILNYLVAIYRGDEARYIGHNPAGSAMILTLLVSLTGTVCSGWLMTTDAYYGVDWVENAHSFFADLTLLLAMLHIGGVLLASVRHRENLVRAMISGSKRSPNSGDIT